MSRTRFTHVVASREGLYVVSTIGYRRVADGSYFGVTCRDGAVFVFQTLGHTHDETLDGRVVRLEIASDGTLVSSRTVVEGLPNGCHQIDFIGDDLWICNTYGNALLRVRGSAYRAFYPIGRAAFQDYEHGYAHLNSLVARGDELWLLKHNGTGKTGKPSELVRCRLRSDTLDVVETFSVSGGGCHNIVFLPGGEIVVCDSQSGRLIEARGGAMLTEVGARYTRGLSIDATTVVVGESEYGTREGRRFLPGFVHFFDRAFRRTATLELPAAPTDIRKLDGDDLGLSNSSTLAP
jgi:hypothetical protein